MTDVDGSVPPFSSAYSPPTLLLSFSPFFFTKIRILPFLTPHPSLSWAGKEKE
jgi:hypothetical protein